MAEDSVRRLASLSGKAGLQGGVEGQVGWLAWWGGWQDGVECRVDWGVWSVGWQGWVVGLARGGPDGWGGWIIGVKNVLE